MEKSKEKIQWNKEKAIEVAKKCKDVKEFYTMHSLLAWCRKNKCIPDVSKFAPKTIKAKKKFKHTKESAMAVAKSYKKLSEFNKNRRDIVSFLRRHGFYKEAISHMERRTEQRTDKELIKAIKKYEYVDELKEDNLPLYTHLWKFKKDIINKYLKNSGHALTWSRDIVVKELKKYKSINEIKRKKVSLYQKMVFLGMIKNWDKKIVKCRVWTKEELIKTCKKYKFFGEFWLAEGNAPVNAAKKMGFELPLIRTQYCGETYLKYFLEKVLGYELKKNRPSFLMNPETGRSFELDGYNSTMKVAFEHNGNHHFKTAFKKDLKTVQDRDKIKIKLCDDNGVKLIIIEDIIYKFKMDEKLIKEHLLNEFDRLGLKYKKGIFNKLKVFNSKVVIHKKNQHLEQKKKLLLF